MDGKRDYDLAERENKMSDKNAFILLHKEKKTFNRKESTKNE